MVTVTLSSMAGIGGGLERDWVRAFSGAILRVAVAPDDVGLVLFSAGGIHQGTGQLEGATRILLPSLPSLAFLHSCLRLLVCLVCEIAVHDIEEL